MSILKNLRLYEYDYCGASHRVRPGVPQMAADRQSHTFGALSPGQPTIAVISGAFD